MEEKENKFNLKGHDFSEEEIAEMMSPQLAAKKEAERKHKQVMLDIMAGDFDDNTDTYKLRYMVEHDEWFLPLAQDGDFEIQNIKKGEFERLFAGKNKKTGKKTDRDGQGGQLLPVYQTESKINGKYKKLNGRELACSLPENISGLLVDWVEDDTRRELSKDYFQYLEELAEAVEIERVLCTDGPVDTAKLRKAHFLSAWYQDNPYVNYDLAYASTHDDNDYFSDQTTVKRMTGSELFEAILKRDYHAGLRIDLGSIYSATSVDLKNVVLSRNFMHRALSQDSCHWRVPEFVARNKEEFELWLDCVQFPKEREIVEETIGAKNFIHAVSKKEENFWYAQETDNIERETPQLVKTEKFELQNLPSSAHEIAPGPSKILCPGRLAGRLFYVLPERDRREFVWRPGFSLGFCRVLSGADIALSKERIKILNELIKLVPEGGTEIPLSSFLSYDGGKFFFFKKEARQLDWLKQSLAQAKKSCSVIAF
ncbi:MAG: hypothetical protein SFY67_06590 [Candidatus Melainabacteria bacterium]|nr:hypothetical protein [Candidatus Melainabacteria bacterium]